MTMIWLLMFYKGRNIIFLTEVVEAVKTFFLAKLYQYLGHFDEKLRLSDAIKLISKQAKLHQVTHLQYVFSKFFWV